MRFFDTCRRMLGAARAFHRDEQGTIAFLFAFLALIIFGVAGAAYDFANQQLTRQRIQNAAQLACQYAKKTSTTAATTAGIATIQSFLNANIDSQKGSSTSASAVFTAVPNGAATVTANSTVNTTILALINIKTLNVSVTTTCYTTPPVTTPAAGTVVLQEDFETGAPTTIQPSLFYAQNYNGWTTTHEGIEVSAGYKAGAPSGANVGELVANGNVSMSKMVALVPGTYELRYWYIAGAYADLPAYDTSYDPAPICSNKASDVAWATASRNSTYYENRIAAYLSADSTNWVANNLQGGYSSDPTSINWRPADLIDVCVYSHGWVERSVMITITTAGNYWLTFAGQQVGPQSYEGGQIDNIRLCYTACAGTRAKAPFETPGTVLFKEDFTSWWATSIWSCSFQGTWAYQCPATNGWTAQGTNLFEIWGPGYGPGPGGYPPGTTAGTMELDESGNRAMSRQFLLPAGTYQIAYWYISRTYSTTISNTVPLCGPSKTAYPVTSLPSGNDFAAVWSPGGGLYFGGYLPYDTSAMSVWMYGAGQTSQPSGMIDYCAFSGTWTQRFITVTTSKPEFNTFWIQAEGTSDGLGANVGVIRICAVQCSDGPSGQTPIAIPP